MPALIAMKIALIGYGKMGQTIEALALERGHEVCARIDEPNFSIDDLKDADIAIEFSIPEAAVSNIEKCFEADIPIVVGTTGWYDDYDRIKKLAESTSRGLFTATNFSIGVNILFHINRQLASIMNQFDDYEVEMNETHHIHKLDHPSGTAVTLAEGIIYEIDRKKSYVGQLEGESLPHETFDLLITSKRENEVPGFHEVVYRSEIDELKLSHNAFSRKGFALGAVIAAEWMKGKRGVYGMKNLLNFK